MSTYVHTIDGRLRIKLLQIKGSEIKAMELQRILGALAGVTQVNANPVTGNVLVLFDTETCNHQRLFDALKQWGYLQPMFTPSPATPAVVKTSTPDATPDVFGVVTKAVVQSALEFAVQRAIFALI